MANYRYIVPNSSGTAAPDLTSTTVPEEAVVGKTGIATPTVKAETVSLVDGSSALSLTAKSGKLLAGSDEVALAKDVSSGGSVGVYAKVTCSEVKESTYVMYGDMAFCGEGSDCTWSVYTGATKVTKSDHVCVANGTKIYTSPVVKPDSSDSAVLPLTEAAQKAMVAAGVTSIEITTGFCLRSGTLILMSDGTERRIEDVRVGDLVLSVDPETGELAPDRVVAAPCGVGRAWDEWTFSDGTVVGTVGRHRFWNGDLGEFMYLEAWNEGEQALSFADASDRSGPLLVSRVHHDEGSEHHTLFTEKYNNYFAAGLLAGNRKSARGRWL